MTRRGFLVALVALGIAPFRVPRRTYSSLCRHPLYDTRCRIGDDAFGGERFLVRRIGDFDFERVRPPIPLVFGCH